MSTRSHSLVQQPFSLFILLAEVNFRVIAGSEKVLDSVRNLRDWRYLTEEEIGTCRCSKRYRMSDFVFDATHENKDKAEGTKNKKKLQLVTKISIISAKQTVSELDTIRSKRPSPVLMFSILPSRGSATDEISCPSLSGKAQGFFGSGFLTKALLV